MWRHRQKMSPFFSSRTGIIVNRRAKRLLLCNRDEATEQLYQNINSIAISTSFYSLELIELSKKVSPRAKVCELHDWKLLSSISKHVGLPKSTSECQLSATHIFAQNHSCGLENSLLLFPTNTLDAVPMISYQTTTIQGRKLKISGVFVYGSSADETQNQDGRSRRKWPSQWVFHLKKGDINNIGWVEEKMGWFCHSWPVVQLSFSPRRCASRRKWQLHDWPLLAKSAHLFLSPTNII